MAKRKKKAPSSARKTKIRREAIHQAMTGAMAAVRKAEEAKAEAGKKVFAAKLIAHIAKEAGIKGPPAAVKKQAISRAKKKAAAASAKAKKRVAEAKKKAAAARMKARKTAAG